MSYAAIWTAPEEATKKNGSLVILIATAVGTSLDAMVVGVSRAFLDVNIVPIAAAIGFATSCRQSVYWSDALSASASAWRQRRSPESRCADWAFQFSLNICRKDESGGGQIPRNCRNPKQSEAKRPSRKRLDLRAKLSSP